MLPATVAKKNAGKIFRTVAKFSGIACSAVRHRGIRGRHSVGSCRGITPCGDVVDEFALGLSRRPTVALLIFFLELLKDLSFFNRLDQGLAFLASLAFGARDALLLNVDVTLQPLKIIQEQQHVRPTKALALFAPLFLQAVPAVALFFSKGGLFVSERSSRFGELLLETLLGVPAGVQQCFEAELKHGSLENRKGSSVDCFWDPGYKTAAGSVKTPTARISRHAAVPNNVSS